MIIVGYSSIDHYRETRKFKTVTGARAYATKWVGKNPELGHSYAISGDGVGKITVSGISLAELFGGMQVIGPGQFAVFKTWNMDEYNGTQMVGRYVDEEEAVLALDYYMRGDHSESYHYGATWENDRWVKWPAPTYNGKTAAEIVAEIDAGGPF